MCSRRVCLGAIFGLVCAGVFMSAFCLGCCCLFIVIYCPGSIKQLNQIILFSPLNSLESEVRYEAFGREIDDKQPKGERRHHPRQRRHPEGESRPRMT